MTDTTYVSATSATNYRVRGQSTTAATSRSASAGTSSSGKVGWSYAGGTYFCDRVGFIFDTSTITGTITDVKLRLVVVTDESTADFTVQICEQDWTAQDPLSDTTREAFFDACLAEADYFDWRSTSGMSVNTQYSGASMTNAYINKAGNTYYSLRSSLDYANTTPTDLADVIFGLPNDGTGNYRPMLIITTESATAYPNVRPLGIDKGLRKRVTQVS